MPTSKIIIYSTPFCGYCQLAKQYLEENKIPYQEIDVSVDEKGRDEMVTKSGQLGVPVIIIEKDGQEEVIVGFQKEKLATLLDLKNN